MIVFLPLTLLYSFQLINPVIIAPLMLVVAGGMLCYQWFLTKTTLQIGAWLAASLVIFDVGLGLGLAFYNDCVFKLI